jgi:hypothetical protein
VCNYCATREARKYANYVGMLSLGNQQPSMRDRVTRIWRRGGIRTPGTGFSQYNGLANCPFHSLVFGINELRSGEMPDFRAKGPYSGAFVQLSRNS